MLENCRLLWFYSIIFVFLLIFIGEKERERKISEFKYFVLVLIFNLKFFFCLVLFFLINLYLEVNFDIGVFTVFWERSIILGKFGIYWGLVFVEFF